MKSHFKFLLAGVLLPASFITFSSTAKVENKSQPMTLAKPYIVEVNSAKGEKTGQFSGTSLKTDPFLISDELGANPYAQDKFSAFPEIRMGIGSKITIYRAPDYLIRDGKKKMTLRSWTENVGDLLSENNIDLGDDDKINFSTNTKLELGMEINIIRVAITNIKKSEPIDYDIIKKEDKTLDQGKTKIQQKGQKGTRVLTYQVRREDGIEISRRLTGTEVTVKPIDEIKIIGIKPVIIGWCKYNDWVLDASIKNNLDPNKLCRLMKAESNGNPNSTSGGGHLGLFQYTEGFWSEASKKAGYAGASWSDAKAQIYTTAWAVTHSYAGRWPGTLK